MESALGWFGEIVQACLSLIPRLIIVRATHEAVKWRCGKDAIRLKPGLHIYWPITTEVEQIVVARQPTNLVAQTLTTLDGKSVVVGAVIVYRINDAVQAIGRIKHDVDQTIGDITQAAIADIIASHTLAEIREGMREGQESLFDRKLTASAGCN